MRGEDGVARVFDAHCPHLGAHLGHGGTVEGEGVRCPFHGWRYDGAGQCVEVPYAKKIPPKARLAAWRAVERNGLVFVWRHAAGEPSRAGRLPDVAELRDDAWTAPERREWIVRSTAQEMAENTVDPAHFRFVHRTNTVPETESAEIRDHMLRVDVEQPRRDAARRTARPHRDPDPRLRARRHALQRHRRTAGRHQRIADRRRAHPHAAAVRREEAGRTRTRPAASARPSSARSSASSPRTSRSGRTRSTSSTRSWSKARARSPCSGAGPPSSIPEPSPHRQPATSQARERLRR